MKLDVHIVECLNYLGDLRSNVDQFFKCKKLTIAGIELTAFRNQLLSQLVSLETLAVSAIEKYEDVENIDVETCYQSLPSIAKFQVDDETEMGLNIRPELLSKVFVNLKVLDFFVENYDRYKNVDFSCLPISCDTLSIRCEMLQCFAGCLHIKALKVVILNKRRSAARFNWEHHCESLLQMQCCLHTLIVKGIS